MIKKIYNKGVENERKNLAIDYLRLMLLVFFIYILLYKFYIKDDFIWIYSLVGLALTAILYFITLRVESIDKYVRGYLFLAPVYSSFLLFIFWKYSIMNMAWYIPVPLGAYILFGKREAYIYACYVALLVTAVILSEIVFGYNGRIYSRNEIIISDTLVFMANLMVIVLLLYYREKIKDIETLNILELLNIKNQDKKAAKGIILDVPMLEALFENIENEIESQELYRDPGFTLSKLSSVLNVNPIYISKAIHHKNYNNFNFYINTLRINYVKELINKMDLQKVTMLYIYSEAGFSNQSTFNRVFKQIEGVSPTEYINSINH